MTTEQRTAPRRFEYSAGTSNKFWAITISENAVSVTYGKIGTAGQSKTKDYSSAAEAQKAYDKSIAEKLREGYSEVSAPTATLVGGASGRFAPPDEVQGDPIEDHRGHVPSDTPKRRETPPTPTVTIPADLPIARELRLSDDDWRWATWRNTPPRERPAAKPFDRAKALDRLRLLHISRWGWNWDWASLEITLTLSHEEAQFWFIAMTSSRPAYNWDEPRVNLGAKLAAQLASENFDLDLSFQHIRSRLYDAAEIIPPEIVMPLAKLLDFDELNSLIFQADTLKQNQLSSVYQGPNLAFLALVAGVRLYLLPYTAKQEIEALRDLLREYITPQNWHVLITPYYFLLASCVGLSNELQGVVESWPDNSFPKESDYNWDTWVHPHEVVFGLGSAQQVERHIRRLHLETHRPEYVKALLACTEFACLDIIRDSIVSRASIDEAMPLLKAFAESVVAPEAAPHMLALKQESKAPAIARQWLDDHPAEAIAGLIPVANGTTKLREPARDYLQIMARKGYGAFVEAQLDAQSASDDLRAFVRDLPEDSYATFDDSTTPDWLRDAIANTSLHKKTTLPGWASAATLPPLVIGKLRLNDAQTDTLLRALVQSVLGAPLPLVAALKQHATPQSLDAFVWALFQAWLADGALSKEKWAMAALGLLGGDQIVFKLTPLIKTWPGEAQHLRAVFGLHVLESIGSDTALMQINGIAQKSQFGGLKSRATQAMEAVAQTRTMSRAELEDRIVPDCGLDERGSTIFDFGTRQFSFALTGDLKPMVRDTGGKLRDDLPKPNSSDDADKAGAAVERWKLLKKQVRDVAKIQAVRLEQAMVTGRRWTVAEFEQLLVRHPLMTHLVRMLVWGGYDDVGALVSTFRVTEDQTYADQNDDDFALDGLAAVGIVHPLHLSDEVKAAWGQIMSDYTIIPPFAQLGRPLYSLNADEHEARDITRFADAKVPGASLVGTLERLGWRRGAVVDNGIFYEHSKQFEGAKIWAVATYEGVAVGLLNEMGDQAVEHCFFVNEVGYAHHYGGYLYTQNGKEDQRIRLGDIDPVVISEVLNDLTTISAKAKTV